MFRSLDSEAALASESALDSDLVSVTSDGFPAGLVTGITHGTGAMAAATALGASTTPTIFTTDGLRFVAEAAGSPTSMRHSGTITFAQE
jgi:hypothetical protein